MRKLRNLLISLLLMLGIGLYILPVMAEGNHVEDEAGLLDDYHLQQLEDYAIRVESAHDCGVYVRFINSYSSFASSIGQASEYIYNSENLGTGSDHNGILLLVSMSEGQYDLCAHGDTANTAFTDHAKARMAKRVENLLSNEDWYLASSEFISLSDSMLTYLEAHGEPFDTNNDPQYQYRREEAEAASRTMKIGATFGLPPLAGLLTCLGLKARNKNTGIQTEAHNYFARNGINFNRAQDLFINRTVMRTPLPRSTSSGRGGVTTINSGGFSHHSGSFRH